MHKIRQPHRSWLRLLLLILLSIFALEALFRLVILPRIDAFAPMFTVFLDAIFVAAGLFPVLYLLHLRPMEAQIRQRERAEAALQEGQRRLQAEEAQREAEERMRLQVSALEAAANGIMIADREGTIEWVNPAFTALTGYTAEEALGRNPGILRSGRHDEPFYQTLWDTILEGDVWSGEMTNRRKDGSHYVCEQIITPVRNANGEIDYFIGIQQDITERKKAEERLERQLNRLSALRQIDITITTTTDLRIALKVLLTQVREQLEVDAADVLLYDPHLNVLEFAAGNGFQTEALQQTHLRVGEGHAGKIALERQFVQVPDLRKAPGAFARSPSFAEEGFVTYCGVPLIAKGEIKGVLEAYHRTPFKPEQEWLDFLESLSHQAALAVDSINAFDSLQRSNMDLSIAYDSTLEGWARALSLRDDETIEHTRRVTRMTVLLGETMGVEAKTLVHIRRGALLHDIGKIGISDQILLKPGPLDKREWELMRQHPVLAHRMLSPIPYLRPALDIPYCHHEKWDGSGYPQGLEGVQIPFASRVFAVVDVWDALSSDRPYREAWQPDRVIAYLKAQKGKHFEPEVVDTFLSLLQDMRYGNA